MASASGRKGAAWLAARDFRALSFGAPGKRGPQRPTTAAQQLRQLGDIRRDPPRGRCRTTDGWD